MDSNPADSRADGELIGRWMCSMSPLDPLYYPDPG